MIHTNTYEVQYDPKRRLLRYTDSDGDWLTEKYNSQGNIVYRKSNFGTWLKVQYVQSGKAVHRIARSENHLGEIRTYTYHQVSGFLQGVKVTYKVVKSTP